MNYLKTRELCLLVAQIEQKILDECDDMNDVIYYKDVNVFDACFTEIFREIKKQIFIKNYPSRNVEIRNIKRRNMIFDDTYRTIFSNYYKLKYNYVIKVNAKK